MSKLTPFHLAIPVDNVEKNRKFYGEILGCNEGRSDEHWVDFDFFGHQLVIHYKPPTTSEKTDHSNSVDGHDVPVPHFGVILEWDDWHNLVSKLKSHDIKFVIEPYIRFEGKPGEQATMFFYDPAGNALEFKAFKDPSKLFAK
ncbi:VOC family protein [Marinigracilibium pacificum]|uniref:VOC family protein n=1 Tax=Marinigracilibium pacificum TaxID=2729599 RepID=A0A848J1Y8_9BACT|nr:VOC family protein [Marinigracilibium pacificum]NMM47212.1 VOC family protein [Marinigracilibium pacificum]